MSSDHGRDRRNRAHGVWRISRPSGRTDYHRARSPGSQPRSAHCRGVPARVSGHPDATATERSIREPGGRARRSRRARLCPSSSALPVTGQNYSTIWRLTASRSPFGANTATCPALPSITERKLRSLSPSASPARLRPVKSRTNATSQPLESRSNRRLFDIWHIKIILGEELDETGGDGGGIPARQVVARTRYRH